NLAQGQVGAVAAVAREVVVQRLDLGPEAQEPEAPVLLEARHVLEGALALVEAATLISILAGDADQAPAGVERPRVVEALERLRGAFVVAAHDRAAMRARVVEGADLAVVAAHEHDRPARDVAPPVVAGLRELRFVADIQPRAVEHAPQ